MWPRFGIKIGNSTLCIAYVKADGKVEVIANKQGDRVSQACLLWDGADEIECGLTAQQKLATRPTQGIINSFQLLLPKVELEREDTSKSLKHVSKEYNVDSRMFELKHSSFVRELSAYDVHVHLFRAERELAIQYFNGNEDKPTVVLSIPSYYSSDAWPLLAQAAEEAGFHVAQVVTESTAAVLAYGIGETAPNADSKFVLTIKCGGLYSHFTLYEVRNGFYMELAVYGPFPIGGRQFTEALVQFVCEEFQRKYKIDPYESRRSVAKIWTVAANCKHILSAMPTTQLYIDSLIDGIDYNTQMSRARFESLIQTVINGFMQTLTESVDCALQQHKNIRKIDHIVLLGATMQIPKLQAAISSRFPEAQLHSSISTDEVVAVGCATQATFLPSPLEQDLHKVDICVCSEEDVLLWHGEDESNAQVLLQKGTLLPHKAVLNIKLCESTQNMEAFKLRSGNQINQVHIKGAKIGKGDVFNIEAAVDVNEDEEPFIRLNCLQNTEV